MDLDTARFNMIEQQIRPWEVLDQRVLDLIAEVPREAFVPEAFQALAFADIQIPLPHGQVMMTPKVEARMLQALAIEAEDRILEIGTGSGYVTALLARSGRQVISVEYFPDLSAAAGEKLNRQGIYNVRLEVGDASKGWPALGPYDVIAVTGSVPVLDVALQEQLAPRGRLFVVVGQAPVMEARLITRVGEGQWACESLFETVLPPLIGIPRPSAFHF